jgi:hypothetical protein
MTYHSQVKAIAVLVLLFSLSSGLGARAAVQSASTAGQLADLCAADPKKPASDAALNYCHGFAQAMVAAVRNYDKKAFCFPSPAPKRAESLRQFVTWVRGAPERAKLTAAIGFYRFLREQYPCGKMP